MRFVEAVIEATNILQDQVDDIHIDLKHYENDLSDVGRNVRAADEARLERLTRVIEALKSEPTDQHPKINGPQDVDRLLRNRIAYEPVENFVVVLMDVKNRVISSPVIAIGGVNACLVDPKSVWKPALTQGASKIILAHNHPTGDVTPSREDKEVTIKAQKAGETLGIELLDHLIFGRNTLSMKEAGHI